MEAGSDGVQYSDIQAAVHGLLPNGLPARLYDRVDPLLDLRGVVARAVKPDDSASRLDALNNLLKRIIRRWARPAEGKALAALYGLEKGYGGRTLTDRRERAATHLGYTTTHFRQKIEPRIIADCGAAVWQDHLRYTARTKYAPPPIEASGDTPVLDAGDYTEQEELASRIWSEVYGLRAEIIAAGHIKKDQTRQGELRDARGKVLWRTARLLTCVSQYLQRYGDRIVQGETDWQVEGLIRLAGWRGGVSDAEAKRLRLMLARHGEDTWHPFAREPLIQEEPGDAQ